MEKTGKAHQTNKINLRGSLPMMTALRRASARKGMSIFRLGTPAYRSVQSTLWTWPRSSTRQNDISWKPVPIGARTPNIREHCDNRRCCNKTANNLP